MSSLYLPLALLGTFGTVVVIGLLVDRSLAERRRAVDILQSQVGEVSSTNLREKDLATRSFDERVVGPAVTSIGEMARRLTPMGMRDRIARKLVLAGSPSEWDADKVAAFKFAGAFGFGAFALLVAVVASFAPIVSLFALGVMAYIGFLIPGAILGQAANSRQEAIRKALPDTMDLLTISVEAGLGFDAALAHVRKNIVGPLADEIGRLLQEMQLGVSRPDAFRHLGERTDVEELRGFIIAMVQAEMFGIGIAKVLRAQAQELRLKRRQRAEEKSIKIAVKLLFPLIFCILPAMFVVTIGPGIIKIGQQFFGISK